MDNGFNVRFTCGHVAGGINDLSAAVCPTCANFQISFIEGRCKCCGKIHVTNRTGFSTNKRHFCRECQAFYNSWSTSRRKAEKAGRKYMTFDSWLKRREAKLEKQAERRLKAGTAATLEPPLTMDEVRVMRKFGKHRSPCVLCDHVLQDKDFGPCSKCVKPWEFG